MIYILPDVGFNLNSGGASMKRINLPLILGVLLIIFIVLLYNFPATFTSKNPLEMTKHRSYTEIENGVETSKVEFSPLTPNKDSIFGTNRAGHDLYTRLIYGTKSTINAVLLIVIMRFVLALLFGVPAGMGVKGAKAVIKIFSTVFTAIPALIFSFLILSINFINGLQMEESIFAYALVLTIVGWGKLANQIQDNTRLIMNEDFIEGEIAIGKSNLKIMTQNILPHLLPNLVVLLFLEAGLVLFLMAQLSVLSIFLGPTTVYFNLDGSIDYIVPTESAWSNELFYGLVDMRAMQRYYYWTLLYPSLAIFTGILSFNLTGEGLRIEFEKRTSRVVSILKRIARMLSPKLYIHQIKKFKRYQKPVLLKTICMMILVMSAFTPAAKSIYEFNADEALDHIKELSKPEYDGRMTGYDGGYKTGEYIIQTLKSYGIEPYDGENFTQEFSINSKKNYLQTRRLGNILVREAEIFLEEENGEPKKYELGKDFFFAAINEEYVSNDFKDEIIEFSGKTILKEDMDDVKATDKDEYILVESVEGGIDRWRTTRLDKDKPHFVNDLRFVIYGDEKPRMMLSKYNNGNTYIIPFGELREKVINGNPKVTIKIRKPDVPKYTQRNIFGVLPGKDWDREDQAGKEKKIIMIGATYDSLKNVLNDSNSAIDSTGIAVNLEIARSLSKLKGELDETVVFVFWDGEYTDYGGSYHYSTREKLYSPSYHDIIYFDIGDIADAGIEKIEVKMHQHQLMKLEGSHEIRENIKTYLKNQKINHIMLPVNGGRSPFHQLYTSADLRINLSAPRYEDLFTENDNIDNIDNNKLMEIGQLIIDMVTLKKLYP